MYYRTVKRYLCRLGSMRILGISGSLRQIIGRWSGMWRSNTAARRLGELTAKAEVAPEEAERFLDMLERRARAAIEVHVQVFGADEGITLEAAFEWFAQEVRR